MGNFAVAALAWAIIPHDIGWSDPDHFQVCLQFSFGFSNVCLDLCIIIPTSNLQYNSWRVFVALCAVPSFLVAIALLR